MIDPNYHASTDSEVIVGLDRELGGNLGVGAAYTWRKVTDVPGFFPRIGMTRNNYTANDPVTANGYTAQTFSPDPALIAAFAGGRNLTNRPDYSTGYNGVEFTLNKRLSNKWFARAAFSYMDWHENIEGPNAVVNPTRTDRTGGQAGSTQQAFGGPQVDGGQIAPRSGGSGKGDIFYNARWQFVANALYQLPANFEVATSIFGRQGYVYPVRLRLPGGQRRHAERPGHSDPRRAALRRPVGHRRPPREHHQVRQPYVDADQPGPVQRVQQRQDPGAQSPGQLGRVR